ncbi:MAG: chromosome segregation protein SMC [Verrucomicrobiaceae bacterium]|nr:chromosome segregation protein SMC [Verrucomicrobiaceae bacterium]
MRLKSLKLHGFKSFANRTDFEFHPGVTGIVGPNGCGKSNVVDAIRWVLGETSAKALRGGEMADVIFNGTDKRKPVGMAEVTLTLADCEETLGLDYNEVAFTRRVFRDGKSEYRLNGNLCRLKDIHEILMDTGIGRTAYSIMEQGKIDMLLSSKPEDRRTVFEEAAGITKFKSQKKEALRKLEYTEANLLRVNDIIEEVKRQINSLNRQANKARRYQELLTDVRVLDVHYSHRQFIELDGEKSELTNSIHSLGTTITDFQSQTVGKEKAIVEARDALATLEAEIASRREQLIETQNRISSAQNRIEFNEERQLELQELINQNSEDITKTNSTLGKEASELEVTAVALQRVTENLARQRQQFEEQENINNGLKNKRVELAEKLLALSQEITAVEANIAEIRAELGSYSTQTESNREREGHLNGELTSLEQEHAERLAESTSLGDQLSAADKSLADNESNLALAEKDYQAARNDSTRCAKELSDLHRELAEKESRLEVLKALVAEGEGLESGTQAILSGLNEESIQQSSIRGLLSSFIEVPSEFIPAIEASLGAHLQTILVSDQKTAEEAINILARGRMGRASIIPENFVAISSDRQLMTLPDGVEAWALDKIKSTENVRPLLEQLLDQTLIVSDLQSALQLRTELPGHSFATLDGAFISADGIMRGGAGEADEAGSLLARLNEVKLLESHTAALNDQLGEKQLELDHIEQNSIALSSRMDECREKLQTAKINQSTLEGKRSLLSREREGLDSKLKNIRWEQGELQQRRETAEIKLSELDEQQRTLSETLQASSQSRSEFEAELNEVSHQETQSAERIAELRTTMAVEEQSQQALQEQQAPITARMGELEAIITRRESEVSKYQDRITNAGSESSSLKDEIQNMTCNAEKLGTALGDVTEQRLKHQSAVNDAETMLREARQELATLTEQRGKEEVKVTQIDLRIENLNATISQRYNIKLEHFEPDSHALLTAIAEQKKARQRREKRKNSIAQKAADEHEHDPDNADPDLEEVPNPDESRTIAENPTDREEPSGIPGEDQPDWNFVEMVIGELRQRLDSMGPVNLEAIEEFEALQERYDFLTKEHEDLINSKDHLHKVISKINRETRTRFADTFEQVRKNFREVFKELFGEQGKANLVLLDETDPLESGIDIIAKPPGKKPQSITLLSGGERAMTAVALLFSIYMVKPSPFCVLDELDAPLDESNIGRFIKLLERFTQQSQFVIVTHNKRTMNRCEVIYGVTQEEFGISKLIGMQFSSSPEPGQSVEVT